MIPPEHTEGPWDVDVEDPFVVVPPEPNSAILAICTIQPIDIGGPKGYFFGPITRANRRLIKTAPRLLVALQECHELLAAICEACVDNPPPGGIDKLENARRAIAEATGTQEWAESAS
jgi:hypothetical protein